MRQNTSKPGGLSISKTCIFLCEKLSNAWLCCNRLFDSVLRWHIPCSPRLGGCSRPLIFQAFRLYQLRH